MENIQEIKGQYYKIKSTYTRKYKSVKQKR
jgi:hypothetical protein